MRAIMTEVFFILTTIFVAYVVYAIVDEQKTTVKSKVSATKPETPVIVVEQPTPQLVIAEDKAAPKAVVSQPVTPNKVAKKDKLVSAKRPGLKNPTTGEIVTAYSNYRFTKRWIKDALVAEGLLEKVYKNNELNTEVDAKIKAALVELETLDKYKI